MEISNGNYQAMASHSLEDVLVMSGCPKAQEQQQLDKKPRPHPEQALKCPRCDSINTKFCYYNNYSLSQPRYFCKGCRRYWTQGGSLRNVPVGGGCRKNKRSSSSSSSSSSATSSSKRPQDHHQSIITAAANSTSLLSSLTAPPPLLSYDSSDLTLAFARLQNQPSHDPFLLANANPNNPNNISATTSGFLDILRNGFPDTINPCSFNNLYYGFGSTADNVEAMVEGGVGGEEVVLPYGGLGGSCGTSTTTTTSSTPATSQGSCKVLGGGGDHQESKVAMNLQWQPNGDGTMQGMDSGSRDSYWPGGVGSSWHGLVNSSLM